MIWGSRDFASTCVRLNASRGTRNWRRWDQIVTGGAPATTTRGGAWKLVAAAVTGRQGEGKEVPEDHKLTMRTSRWAKRSEEARRRQIHPRWRRLESEETTRFAGFSSSRPDSFSGEDQQDEAELIGGSDSPRQRRWAMGTTAGDLGFVAGEEQREGEQAARGRMRERCGWLLTALSLRGEGSRRWQGRRRRTTPASGKGRRKKEKHFSENPLEFWKFNENHLPETSEIYLRDH